MKKNENTPPSESITPEELISRLKANLFSAEAKSASEKDGRAAENDEDGNIAETAFEEIDDNSVLITDAQDKEKTEIDKDASSESRADSDAAGTIELFESEDLLDEDEIAQSDIRQGAFSAENFEKDEMENDALQESIFNLDFPEDESVSDNGELESVRGMISDFISRYSKDEEKAEVKAPAENKEDTKPENKESAKPDSKENTKPAASKVYRFNRVPSLKDKNKIEVRSDVDLVNELTRADY